MLNESEKKNIDFSLEKGLSYSEIARDLILWRHHFAVIDLRNEIEAYIKEKNQ